MFQVFLLCVTLITYTCALRVASGARSLALPRGYEAPRTLVPLKSSFMEGLSTESELATEEKSADPLKIIIAGAPAAGKGTQCENIKDDFNVVHLSTGDILRAAVKEGSELGVKAKEYMDNAQLVPDELITNVVCERLKQSDCKEKGWLLDGFPRTLAQAEALEGAGMSPDCFLLLNVPQEILVERVTGRRTDPDTGKIYHMKFSPPPSDDEALLSRLVQRSDDTEEKIVVRYQDFLTHVSSVKACYEGICVEVDGTQSPAAVAKVISDALSEAQTAKEEAIKEARAKNKQATNLVMGLYSLYTLDRLLAAGFVRAGLTFPPPLVGMVALFSALCAIDNKAPAMAAKFNTFLTPASAFLKLWLGCLLVPPIVVAPLKVALFKTNWAKFLSIIASGFVFSLLTAGFIANVGTKTSDSNKAKFMENEGGGGKGTGAVSPCVSSPEEKRLPLPTLPSFQGPALVTMGSLIICALSTSLAAEKTALVCRRVFGTSLTVASYLFANQYTPAALKTILHPVIVSGATIYGGYAALAKVTGAQTLAPVLATYYGSPLADGPGDILSRLLGTAIISFGVQLYQYKNLLFRNKFRFVSSSLFTALAGILTSSLGARFLGVVGAASQSSILTRCVTTPLAVAAGRLTGADVTLCSTISLITGVIGASIGEKLLQKVNITDPVSQGMAIGGAAHSLGASSLAYNPVKFSSAIVSMCLTGLWTVALLGYAPFRTAILAFASTT